MARNDSPQQVAGQHGEHSFPDPVSDYTEAESTYLHEKLSDDEVFYTRYLGDWRQDEDMAREGVESLRALSFFDVAVVPFELKRAPDDKEFQIRSIEVKGTTTPNFRKPEVAEAYEDLTLGLLGYYYDRYSKHLPSLGDIAKQGQFVYGTFQGIDKPKPVLVDLDVMQTDPDNKLAQVEELYRLHRDLLAPLEEAQGKPYSECRGLLLDCLDVLSESESSEVVQQFMNEVRANVEQPVKESLVRRFGRYITRR